MLKPKILSTLTNYSIKLFFSDLTSGVIVGIVALPLAIAFAIASGVSPDKGLWTAIIAGFIISLLGGSRVQIGGPTGAFVIIIYGIIQKHGLNGLVLATILAGFFLILFGLARFGGIIKFIPHPVIVGFTSGIAVIIFSAQAKDFFGLPVTNIPVEFFSQWSYFVKKLPFTNYASLSIGLATLLIMGLWPRFSKKIPGSIIAVLLSSMAVHLFQLNVETIGSRFGELPHTWPQAALPSMDIHALRSLLPSAITIALLAGIESLLSAVVADGMIGGKHRPNMELIAQGIANMASAIFGGIPATGAIARTATNIKNGGKTPIAGIVHALTLFILVFFFGHWVKLIPMASLAGILVVVAYHMSEWRSFLMILKSPRSDVLVLLVTFIITITVDLVMAIHIGVVLAALLFIRRMVEVTSVGILSAELIDQDEQDDPNAIGKRQIPDHVEIYEINGPFFFGASYKFMEAMTSLHKTPKIRIIRMRNVLAVDATGIYALKSQALLSKKKGIVFILSDLHAQPLVALDQADVLDLIGCDNIFGNIDDALNRARTLLNLPLSAKPTPFIPTVKREMDENISV